MARPDLQTWCVRGYLPETIVNYIALLGWCPKENRELFTLDELAQNFSIDGISKSPAVFDYDKLKWFNAEYIRSMEPEKFLSLAMPYFREVFGEKECDWQVLASILQPRVIQNDTNSGDDFFLPRAA